MSDNYYIGLPRQNEYRNATSNDMYYIGFEKGNNTGTRKNGHKESTLIINMARCIDYLSPDLWIYVGRFKITKKAIREMSKEIIARVNEKHGTNFVRAFMEQKYQARIWGQTMTSTELLRIYRQACLLYNKVLDIANNDDDVRHEQARSLLNSLYRRTIRRANACYRIRKRTTT